MKYYKVLTRKNNKLFSMVWNTPSTIEYKLGEVIRGRDGSGLFVFDSLPNAQAYYSAVINEIWLVECENPRLCVTVVDISGLWKETIAYVVAGENLGKYYGLLNKYWKQRDQFPERLLSYAPPGTMVCDSLKLVQRVK